MNFFVSFKAVWRVIWLFTFIASNCICLKWASVCTLLMSSLSNASLHSLHPISQACYMNLFVTFKTVCCIKWLFTFIASKLSLTKMVFCVFFKTVEAVKFLLTLIASLFSSLSYIYMNLFVSFKTVWCIKWLFTFIASKLSLTEMGFCVFVKTVENVKCLFKFIASIFSISSSCLHETLSVF